MTSLPEWRSRKALPRGKISFATKSEICCVMDPSASPGKVRLKFKPSTGEVRLPADRRHVHCWLALGSDVPAPRRGQDRVRDRKWRLVPHIHRRGCRLRESTVGPLPLLITAIGTRVTPQASSWVECGSMIQPICLPGLSRSMVENAVRRLLGEAVIQTPSAGWHLMGRRRDRT